MDRAIKAGYVIDDPLCRLCMQALGTEGQRGAADEEREAGEAQVENTDCDHEYGEGAECLGCQTPQISSATGHRATTLSLSASATGSAAAQPLLGPKCQTKQLAETTSMLRS